MMLVQFAAVTGVSVTVNIESASDLAGNTNSNKFSWSFVVEEPACGRAEFLGDLVSSQLVLNSASNLAAGVDVSVYNPDQATQTWVDNLRIQSIELVYRSAHSATQWMQALDLQGSPVEFFDDVSLTVVVVIAFCNCSIPSL